MSERICKLEGCETRLADGNPNNYCFAHIHEYAWKDKETQYQKDKERTRVATMKFKIKKAAERDALRKKEIHN